jgi:hypothetical protein
MDMSKEAEESTLLRAVTRQRLVNTYKIICMLQYNDVQNV